MKFRWLALFAVALIAIWYFRPVAEEPREAAPANTPAPIAKTAAATPPTTGAPRAQVPPAAITQTAESDDPHVVEFTVKDGLAIAFGDVILGTPDETDIGTGYYKMPPPQFWDKPEIPYAIDSDLPDPSRVKEALRHIQRATGVKFVAYDRQPDAIVFQKGKEHCLSVLGRQGGLQPIRLSAECGWHEITHEVLHALGFIHEQSRADRDDFVEVVWDNIEKPYRAQFTKLPEDFLGPAQGSSFDYHSIMLYGPTLFARVKGDLTLKTRTGNAIQPSREGLSPEDIRRIKRHFNLD